MIDPDVLRTLVLGPRPGGAHAAQSRRSCFGITKRVKARLQYRRGPSLLQPYRDLAKWWRKESVESDAASPLTAIAPALVLAAVLVATLLVPIVGGRPPLDGWGDLLVVVGLHGPRPVRARPLGARRRQRLRRDGQQPRGRDRDARRARPPAGAHRRRAGGRVDRSRHDRHASAAASGISWYTPALLLAAGAFAIVAVAETGHEPIDNPDTHLELTMIHEGMLLEASGPRLAILMYAAELKLVLVAGLFAAAFLPAGLAASLTPRRC